MWECLIVVSLRVNYDDDLMKDGLKDVLWVQSNVSLGARGFGPIEVYYYTRMYYTALY